jgi:hypothetical protein
MLIDPPISCISLPIHNPGLAVHSVCCPREPVSFLFKALLNKFHGSPPAHGLFFSNRYSKPGKLTIPAQHLLLQLPPYNMNNEVIFHLPGNGVYTYPLLSDNIDALSYRAFQQGFKFYSLNALFILNRKELLHALFEVCEFPDHFGFNWDALDDCLRDYSFAPASGYLFAIQHADHLKQLLGPDYELLTEIFRDAGDHWEKQGVLFKLLVDHH